jgi:hypothetical protein
MANPNQNINQGKKDFKEIADIVGALDDGFQSLADRINNVVDSISEASDELKNFSRINKDINSTMNSLARSNEKLIKNQRALMDGQLSSKKINEQIKDIEATREVLNQRLNNLRKIEYKDINEKIKQNEAVKNLEEQIKELTGEVEGNYRKQLDTAKEIEKKLGSTGKLLKGISKIPVLGNLLDAEKALAAAQEAAAKKGSSRAQVIQAAASSLFKSLKDNLFSLEAVITFVVNGLFKGSQAMADFRKETGMAYSSAYQLRAEMSAIALLSNDNYITSEKLAKAYSSMTQQLGIAADVLGGEALVSATNLEQRLGMSAQESATITANSRLQSKNTEEVLSNSIKTVGTFNKQNKTALNVREVLKESAKASKGMQATLGFSTENLIKAAAEAKRLGLNLSEVENIADSLLNFESSIQAELEAELLTGRQINLEKERLLALNGDMEGLANSLSENAAIQNAFEGKNVIQQKALAAAVGMTRDQLAQVALQQKFNNLSAEEFKNRYGETTYESLKARSATEKFQDALQKITSVLGDILALFSPILDVIALIVDNSITLGITLIAIASLTLPKMVKSISSMYKDMKGLVTSSIDFVKNMGKSSFADKTKDLAGKTTGPDKDGLDKTKDLAGKTKGATSNMGKDIKNFLTNVSKGIQSFSKVDFKDILKVGATAVAFLAFTPAIPALLILAIPGLGKGINANLKGISKGLEAFGKVAKSGYVWAGVGLLAAFNVALIPLGYTLNLMAPAIEAFGKAIKSTLEGVGEVITDVADGFVKLLGALTLEGVLLIAALGPALISLGTGLSVMGASLLLGGGAAILALLTLSSAAQPMKVLADSVLLLASSLKLLNTELKSLDEDKLDTLSSFASNTAEPMSKIALGMGSLVGGGSSKELAEIRDILNQLLTKTGNVYLDSTKVGTTQIMGTYRTQ